jgi:hypothetical protein
MAIKCWETAWEDLATFKVFPSEIRRLIYTTNTVEGYHRQIRQVIKTKASFPTGEAVRKIMFLADRDIMQKWTMPIPNWANILNQLSIRLRDGLFFSRQRGAGWRLFTAIYTTFLTLSCQPACLRLVGRSQSSDLSYPLTRLPVSEVQAVRRKKTVVDFPILAWKRCL